MRWFSLFAIFYFFFASVAFADPVTHVQSDEAPFRVLGPIAKRGKSCAGITG
jgi:hypothetical protein